MITSKVKRKINPMLMKVIFISVILHVIAGLIAGVVTIATHVIKEDVQFEEPPAIAVEEPPVEVKVQIKSPPSSLQNIRQSLAMRPVANIAVAQVNVDLPAMNQSYTVSSGIAGVGGGNLLGGAKGSIGLGMSDVSVFGLKTRAERILFVIDASRQMVTDKKGGLNSYQVIKDEVTDMVSNLTAGALFNVILHDNRGMIFFKPNLVPAGNHVHQQLITWISTVNSNAQKSGLAGVPNVQSPKLTASTEHEMHELLKFSGHRDNVNAYLAQVALEQRSDAIFFITGYHRGFSNLIAPASKKQLREFERLKATRVYQKQLAEHRKEMPQMEHRVASKLSAVNAERAKKGMPPRVLASNGVYHAASVLGLRWNTPHPGHGPGHQKVEPRDVSKYFKELIARIYTDIGKDPPSINVVLFLAGDEKFETEWKRQLDQYVRLFRGKMRVIRGADEIKSARSSNTSKG